MNDSRLGRIVACSLLTILGTGFAAAQQVPRVATTREAVPKAYGVDAYSVTTVSAIGFYPEGDLYGYSYFTSGSLGRSGYSGVAFFAPLDLPAGVVIDYVGLNSTTDTPGGLTVALYKRHKDGTVDTIVSIASTVHDWDTETNVAPIGRLWEGKSGNALILHVERGAVENFQFFGWVEVWWRRVVSPPPGSPTFNDVPGDHPFYQYVEALAASGITAGCGNGNYCPNNPVTRGQMAVFLAKALGLHWPGGFAN